MLRRVGLIVCLLVLPWTAVALADGDGGAVKPLTRAEVAQLKKMLAGVVDALGNAPAGYDRIEEDFDLPTQYQPHKTAGRFVPLNPSVRLQFGSDRRKAEKSAEQAAQEFQRKYVEATTKGDMEAVSRLSQEYQKMMGEIQMKAMAVQSIVPIQITIRANDFQTTAIDPDGVVFEKPGVIAISRKSGRQDSSRVSIFFDPVSLKETETLAQVSFVYPENGLAAKTAAANIVIDMEGPQELVRKWAKGIDCGAVLATLK